MLVLRNSYNIFNNNNLIHMFNFKIDVKADFDFVN